jgi:hypothetical protein
VADRFFQRDAIRCGDRRHRQMSVMDRDQQEFFNKVNESNCYWSADLQQYSAEETHSALQGVILPRACHILLAG